MNNADVNLLSRLLEEYKTINPLVELGSLVDVNPPGGVEMSRKCSWFILESTSMFKVEASRVLEKRVALLVQYTLLKLAKEVNDLYKEELNKLGVNV